MLSQFIFKTRKHHCFSFVPSFPRDPENGSKSENPGPSFKLRQSFKDLALLKKQESAISEDLVEA